MAAAEKRAEIIRLAALLRDGQSSEAERQQLGQLLLDDPAAQTYYRQYISLEVALEWMFVERSFPIPSAEVEQADNPPRSPILGFLGGVVDYVNHSRRLMFLFVAVMLSGWFIFQVGSVLIGRWWAGNAQVADRGADHPALPGAGPKHDDGVAGGSGQPHGNAVAWLSGSVNSRWQVVAKNPAEPEFWEIGTTFPAAQQVKLVAGLGEITFRSGAKVILTAPTQFSVTSALATDLQVGKLSVLVPHDSSHQGATGFTVNTPAGSVVDLGTEFGVEVTPDRLLDVQVFIGEVKVSTPPADGSGAEGGPDVHVPAGKTVHVVPGKPPAVVESDDKDRFQRDLKIARDSGDKQMAAYLDAMRQLKPVVWLRMEGKETERTIHDEAEGADSTLHWDGPGNPFVAGAVGKGLWLRGPQLKDYAVIPDYPKAEHGKLSVSAWVYADKGGKDFGRIAANWGDRNRGQFHFALVPIKASDPDSQVVICADVVQPDKSVVDVREDKSKPFPLNQWQHVAFTTDGATLRLYREGREVATAKQEGLLFPTPLRSLGVGVKTGDSGDVPSPELPGFFSGKLDEIAIFNDALSPEDIKKLSAAPPR